MVHDIQNLLKAALPADININVAMVHTVFQRTSVVVASTILVLWVLFQKKLLPHPAAKFVSKLLFYPTFPITAMMRYGNYWTKLDNTLMLGCAPMGYMNHPDKLYKMGVRGVINMCYEYSGPKSHYARLGIKQLYLPTVDHFEPSVDYMKEAVAFIKEHQQRNEMVYVHCKAAHGRAAAIALCWLANENKNMSLQELNALMVSKRKVRKDLYDQPNVKTFFKNLAL